MQHTTTDPETSCARSGRKSTDGLSTSTSPFLHLEHADLVGRAEPVLHRPQYAKKTAFLSLEIQNRVHHVLQHLGAGDGTVLGHVFHQKDGNACLFREENKPP